MTSVVERPCRLRCSDTAAEEFQGPNGDWFSIYRAIVLDSWLTWKDALPDQPMTGPLDTDVASAITTLACKIHAAHMQLPDYRRLTQTPFRVGRWWDPFATDGWEDGSRVLIRLEHYSAQRFASKIPARLELVTRSKSEHWLEISLSQGTPCPLHSLDYDRVVTTESA
jgi:hypothetical protein